MNTYPSIIEIQFSNLCNANCIICPYHSMNYKKEIMSDNLFKKFIEDIKGKNIKRIIPYLNNEPFLDKTFLDKLEQIRNANLNAEIEISTNAVFLTEDKIKKLLDLNITELRISVFGFKEETYKMMMPTSNYNLVFKHLELISKYFRNSETIISIVMIDNGKISEDEFNNMEKFANELGFNFCRWGFLDRAKNVSNFSNNYFYEDVIGCEQNRPTERMHILSNGNVIFCCQDWSHEYICGNLNDNTIEEIWNSPTYINLRESLFDKNKKSPNLCKNCKLAIKNEVLQ